MEGVTDCARARRTAMSVAEPALRRWTAEEYHRVAETGVFGPDERLELIEGEIFRMPAMNGPHATASTLTESALREVFAAGYVVRVQKPLAVSDESEPEPDVAVVRGSVRDYARLHPSTAVLVAEAANSSLRFDRTRKEPLYARAGIPEYWILNLIERVLEVCHDPDRAAGA
jgi:Uma2 family endonuclease